VIAAILFDVGGLIVGTPFEVLDTAWRGPLDPSTDPLWRALQTGDVAGPVGRVLAVAA